MNSQGHITGKIDYMRTYTQNGVALIIILMAIMQANAQRISEKDINGRWRVDIEESIRRTDKSDGNRINKMPSRAQDGLRKAFADREFNFDSENRLILTMKVKNEPRALTGKWEYNQKKEELVTTFEEKPKTFSVKWIEKDLILLDFKKKSNDPGTLKFLCLRRIN